MSDWFRNSSWDDSIEQAFFRKLERSRLKAQYLRVQASILARTHPEVTLQLLDRYFELPADPEQAAAHVDRATALLSLNRADEAVEAYEAAIAREAEYPNVQTQAHLELPYVVAVEQLSTHYERALEALDEYRSRLMFPLDHFKWHAARAIIAAELDQKETATEQAELALKAAERKYSGFPSHPEAGLVGDGFEELKGKLKEQLAA